MAAPLIALPLPSSFNPRTAACTPHEQTLVAATDRPLDRLVYALYGLSEAEIKVVEGG